MDVFKIEKTPTLWYTLYAVNELAFPLRGEVIA